LKGLQYNLCVFPSRMWSKNRKTKLYGDSTGF